MWGSDCASGMQKKALPGASGTQESSLHGQMAATIVAKSGAAARQTRVDKGKFANIPPLADSDSSEEDLVQDAEKVRKDILAKASASRKESRRRQREARSVSFSPPPPIENLSWNQSDYNTKLL